VERIFAFMESVNAEAQEYLVGSRDEPTLAEDVAETQKALDDAEYLLAKFEANKREYLKVLTPAEFASELASLRADATEARLAHEQALAAQEVDVSSDDFTDFRTCWEEWTHESRKEWLAGFIDRVVVTSAQRRRIPISERITPFIVGRGDPAFLDADGSLRFA
jgi:hypothetical protein